MGRLTVAVRVRPPTSEKEFNGEAAAENSRKTTVIINEDNVILNETTIFQAVGASVLDSLLVVGQNCSIVAYGQTGSGKTFTMLGEPTQLGIIPQICNNLIDSKVNCTISFYEIYNEKVFDLLSDCRKALNVRQHPDDGPFVLGLQRQELKSSDDLRRLLQIGIDSRTTAKTASHHSSSRSHAIFTIYLNDDKGPKLHLVDLAGSERPHHHASKLEIRESAHINRSLATLGNVILCLSGTSTARSKFAPYRDSALTWLLRDSLGGRAQTVMIATISPEAKFYSETLKTLRYANRARSIFSLAADSENRGGRHGISGEIEAELRREIDRLRVALTDRLNHHRRPELDHRFKVCHCQRNADGQPCVVRYESVTRSCMTSPVPVELPDDVTVITRSKSVALSPIMDLSPRDDMDANHNSSSESTSIWDGESPRILIESSRGVLPSPIARQRPFLLADESDFTKSGSFIALDYSIVRQELKKGERSAFTKSLTNAPLTKLRRPGATDENWAKSFPETQLRRSKIDLEASASRLSPVEPDRPKFAFLRRSFRRQYLPKKRKSPTEPEDRETEETVPENLEKMDKISLSSALDSPLPMRSAPNMQVSLLSLESSATASSSFFDPQSFVSESRESGRFESGGSLKKKLRKRAEEKRSRISATSSSNSQASTRSNSPVHLPSIYHRASTVEQKLSLSYSMDMLKRAKLLADEEHAGDSNDDEAGSIPSFDGDSIEPSSDHGEIPASSIGLTSMEESVHSLRKDSGFLASSLLNESTRRDDEESIPEEIAEEIVRDIFTETRLNVGIESDSLLSGNSFHSPSVSKSPDSLDDSGGRALIAVATTLADERISAVPIQQHEYYYQQQEVTADITKEADIIAMGERGRSPSRIAELIGAERKHKLLTRSSATDLTGVQHHHVIRRQLSHGDSDGVDVKWTENLPQIMEHSSPVPGQHDSPPTFAQSFDRFRDSPDKNDLPTESIEDDILIEEIPEGHLSQDEDSLNEPAPKTIRLSISSIDKGDDDVSGERSSDSRSPQIDRRRLSAISDIPDEGMENESWAKMISSWTDAEKNKNNSISIEADDSKLTVSQKRDSVFSQGDSEENEPQLPFSKSPEMNEGKKLMLQCKPSEEEESETNYLLLDDGRKTPITPLKEPFKVTHIFPNRGSRSSTKTDLFASTSSEGSQRLTQQSTSDSFSGKHSDGFAVVRELPANEGINEENLLELLSDSSRGSSRNESFHEAVQKALENREDLLSDFDPFGARRASEAADADEPPGMAAATHEADLLDSGLTLNDFLRQCSSPSSSTDEGESSYNLKASKENAEITKAKDASESSVIRAINDESQSSEEEVLSPPSILRRSREIGEMKEKLPEEPFQKTFVPPLEPGTDIDVLVRQPKERMYYESSDSEVGDQSKEETASGQLTKSPEHLLRHPEMSENIAVSLNPEEHEEKDAISEESSAGFISTHKTTMNEGASASSPEHSGRSNVLKERNTQNEEGMGPIKRASVMYDVEESSSGSDSDVAHEDTSTPLPLIKPHEIRPSSSEEIEEEIAAAAEDDTKEAKQSIAHGENIKEINAATSGTGEAVAAGTVKEARVSDDFSEEDHDFMSSPLRDSGNSSKRSFKRDFDASSDEEAAEADKGIEGDFFGSSSTSKYSTNEVQKHITSLSFETEPDVTKAATLLSGTETQFPSQGRRANMYDISSDDEFSVEFNQESDTSARRGKKSVSSVDQRDSSFSAAAEDTAHRDAIESTQAFANTFKDPGVSFSSEDEIVIPPGIDPGAIADISGRRTFYTQHSEELLHPQEQQDDTGFRGFQEALLKDRIAEAMKEADVAGPKAASTIASTHAAAEADQETGLGASEASAATTYLDVSGVVHPDEQEETIAGKEPILLPDEEFDDEKSPAAFVASQLQSDDEDSDFEQMGRKRSIQEEIMLAEKHSSPKSIAKVEDVAGAEEGIDKYLPDFEPESSSASLKALDESVKVERVQGTWDSDESSEDDDDIAGSELSSISSKGRKRVSWLEGADVAYVLKQEEENRPMPSFYNAAERLKKNFLVQRVEEGAPEFEKIPTNPFLEDFDDSEPQFESTNPFIRDLTESQSLPIIHERDNTEESDDAAEKRVKSEGKYSSSFASSGGSTSSSRSASTSASHGLHKPGETGDNEKSAEVERAVSDPSNNDTLTDDVIPGEIERKIETYGDSSPSSAGSVQSSPKKETADQIYSFRPSSSSSKDEIFNEKEDLDPFGLIGVSREMVRKKMDSFYDSFDVDEDTEGSGKEDSTLDKLMRSHDRELRNELRLEAELESRMNLPGAIEEEDEEEEKDSHRSAQGPEPVDQPDSFDLDDSKKPEETKGIKEEEKSTVVPELFPSSSNEFKFALEYTLAHQDSDDSNHRRRSGSFAEFVNNMVSDIDESAKEELSKIMEIESPSPAHSTFDSSAESSPKVKENEEHKKAIRNLYGMLMKTEGDELNEEVLNVTVVDGVPYITMEPTSSWTEAVEALDLNPDTVENLEAMEERNKQDSNFEDVTAEASKEFSFERQGDQAEGVAQLVYEEIPLDSGGSLDQGHLRGNPPSLSTRAFANEEDRQNFAFSASFPPLRGRRSLEAEDLHTDQILLPSSVPPTLNFDPMQMLFVERLDQSDAKYAHDDDETDQSGDDDGFDLTDEEFVYERDDKNSNGSPRKSVSWSDFRGHNLEAGPSLLLSNGDHSAPVKPILKNSPRISVEQDFDFYQRMQRSLSESRLADAACQTESTGPIAELRERTYSITSIDEQPSPSSTASMRSVLRYNATRLFKDLRMLVLERDRTIEALEKVKSAEQAGFVSLTTKHHQQSFRDRLIESRVALDVRIDDVWEKLKSEDLKDLSPAQKEWLFSSPASAGLTYSERKRQPPALPARTSSLYFQNHYGNGIKTNDPREEFAHSFFDYPRKLAKLRQAFIGAAHEDTGEMLTANQAIENRTADWVYHSSDDELVREFNRLAAALVDRVVPETNSRRSRNTNSERIDAEILRLRQSLAQSYY